MKTCKHGVHGGAKYVILYGPLNRMILLDFIASLNPQFKHCYFTEWMKQGRPQAYALYAFAYNFSAKNCIVYSEKMLNLSIDSELLPSAEFCCRITSESTIIVYTMRIHIDVKVKR